MAGKDMMPGPFADAFRDASIGESAFEVWQRFVYMAAYEIATACGEDASPFRDMAQTAHRQAEKKMDAYRAMFDAWVTEIDARPFQDFLGDAFMRLGIGNESGGQFFTPYHLAKLNAIGALGESTKLPARGWVSVSEPACGAGANVIAACDVLNGRGVDWQRSAYFVCQDVSEMTALMCYMQASMIGIAATVIVGDTLRMDVRYRLHTFTAKVDCTWTARSLRGELADVW